MSNEINDGGPAYPFVEMHQDGSLYHEHVGMSLRDYLAEGAMRALIGTAKYSCLDGLSGYENVTALAAYNQLKKG